MLCQVNSKQQVRDYRQLMVYLLLVLPVMVISGCGSRDDEGEIRLLGELKLEDTPVFRLSLSPDDQYIVVLTWKNYAHTLDDRGAEAIRARIISVRDSSVAQTVELPDYHEQTVVDEAEIHWQDPGVLRIHFGDDYYAVDPNSGRYIHDEHGAVFFPPSTPSQDGECSWSPNKLYCAAVKGGTLRIRDARGRNLRRQYLCDNSYPVCDKYPLLWTSDDRLVFITEGKESLIWIWTR